MAGIHPDYLPSRKEIKSRAEALIWMQEMSWPLNLIDSIFLNDNPALEEVRRLVYAHGPDEACRRLMLFVE